MPYVPQTLAQFRPPIAADGTAYARLWDNHDELYSLYTGVIGDHSAAPVATPAGPLLVNTWRFTSRGGSDFGTAAGLRVKLTVVATATGTGGVVQLANAATAATVAVSGVLATYTVTVTPETADEQWLVNVTVNAASTVTIHAWSAEWVATPSAALFPSGWRRGAATWKAANAAINTEGFGRLTKGPVAIAKDRPICIFAHFARIGQSLLTKTKGRLEQLWGRYDQDYQETAARGLMPRCDTRPRTYTVDWYLRSTGAGTATIRIGGQVIAVATPNVWGTATFTLTQADHEFTVGVTAAVSQTTYFEALQIWRGE